jgi:hypothetical protein
MIHSYCGHSEKEDKRIYNRALRSRTRQNLRTCNDYDDLILPEVRDVSNPWSMAKDGKYWSTWLADYRRTLKKVSRTRDGRNRYFLTITDATFAHHKVERHQRQLKGFCGFRFSSDEDRVYTAADLNVAMNIIRK